MRNTCRALGLGLIMLAGCSVTGNVDVASIWAVGATGVAMVLLADKWTKPKKAVKRVKREARKPFHNPYYERIAKEVA